MKEKVKTRLAKNTTFKFATDIYKAFVEDLLVVLETLDTDFILAFNNKEAHEFYKDYDFFIQEGVDLGEKMKNAFLYGFNKGYEKVILIGSDTPQLKNYDFNKALESLDKHDSVFGPAIDGGYYLVGFNQKSFKKECFEDIAWSTNRVLAQSLKKLISLHVKLLEEKNDIDTIEDLEDFYTQNNFTCKNTNEFKYLFSTF